MKKIRPYFIVALGLLLVWSGCGKKAPQQADLLESDFDTLSIADLTQFPQPAAANQQAAIEVLPIEDSPVTPSILTDPILPEESPMVSSPLLGLSYEQKIQTALAHAGFYSGKIDGKIGPMTEKAVRAFQSKYGLKVDGKVGPQTWAVLEPFLSES